ncbi:hypothetical protein MIMGU_mgv1a006033mg [Erythranthe guttata]|uniref:protein-serine/threonine phosphatase n=1 Tax=Erythranthe guttata TaxID=4155 RepID=A0A022PZW3_ERYGU|nr:hypothetical protein MIMGU_mgv1a006033mg [Erythranthe guttata]
MEQITPAVAVAVSLTLDNPVSENTPLNPDTESATKPDMLETGLVSENVQESEEDEILSITTVNLLPLDPTSNLALPLNTASETSLPIAVEIEGTENGCSSSGPTIKASVVAVKLSNEKDSNKSGVKSVFELDCLPLWGSVSVIGHRPEMEDSVMAVPDFMKIPIKMFIGDSGINGISQTLTHLTSHFFGVYDGHGGSQVANYCRDRLHLALVEELKNVKDINNVPINGISGDTRQVQWEKVFTDCFLKVDEEVSGKSQSGAHCNSQPVAAETVGSTAVVAVVCSSHIIVANCGDSRAVLYRGKEVVALSVDHKPNREDEYARIEASGGKVIPWNGHRVFGVLAMSRAIGDRYLKPWIIPEPEIMFVPRAREDECLVLATDGLWDVMTNEEVCEVARKRILIWHKKNGTNYPLADRGRGVDLAAQAAADYLSNLAIQKGSKDNISIIVVDLKAQRKFKSKS